MMLWRLGVSLRGHGWQQQVVSLLPAGPVAERLAQSGIPVTSLSVTGAGAWRGLARLRRTVRQGPGDLVHGWMYHGNLAALASRSAGGRKRPVIWGIRQSMYGLHREKPLTSLVIRLGARLSGRVDAIVYNSNVSRSQHEQLGYRNRRVLVIPNGFDVNHFRPDGTSRSQWRAKLRWPMDATVVLLLAREHPMKNHAGFLRAIAPLARNRRDVLVALAGRNIDASNRSLLALALELGIADRITLFGEVRETAELLAASDILCSASLWGEGFPNAVGEAMASGLLCVVTDVGDSAWVVGHAGFVVPPDESALREALARALNSSQGERLRLGELSRARIAEHFSLESVAAAYQQLYLDVL